MIDHDENIARIQHLREVVTFKNIQTGNSAMPGSIYSEILDVVEDGLFAHAPTAHPFLVSEWECCGTQSEDPCPDYARYLRLLDALEGGAQ